MNTTQTEIMKNLFEMPIKDKYHKAPSHVLHEMQKNVR